MNDYETMVTLDLSCKDLKQVINAKQLDNLTRKISIDFVDEEGNPLDVPSDATAEFRVQRPDGTLITTSTVEKVDLALKTVFKVYLTDAMLEVSGRAIADLRVIHNSQIISGGAFFLDIYQTPTGTNFSGYLGTIVNQTMMTKEQYDSTIPSDNTIYYVIELDGSISMYLGSKKINFEEGGGGILSGEVNFLVTGVFSNLLIGEIVESEEQ